MSDMAEVQSVLIDLGAPVETAEDVIRVPTPPAHPATVLDVTPDPGSTP